MGFVIVDEDGNGGPNVSFVVITSHTSLEGDGDGDGDGDGEGEGGKDDVSWFLDVYKGIDIENGLNKGVFSVVVEFVVTDVINVEEGWATLFIPVDTN